MNINLSNSEEKVNRFLAESRICRRWKNAAASVIQQTWRIFWHKKQHVDLINVNGAKLWNFQRKFIIAICV